MVIESKFNILEVVKINEIFAAATVLKIQYDGVGILYYLDYWFNGEMKSVWLYERELSAVAKK